MHVQLSNDKLLNLTYFEDAKQGFHDKKVVVIYLTNGTKFIENFATEKEAEEEVERIREAAKAGGGLVQKDTVDDFPKTGNTGTIYIAKDTGQTYYWDKVSKTYVKTGTAGRTGVYSYDNNLPETIGATTIVKKEDLTEILKPSVDYSEGSEIIGSNSVHGIITKVEGDDVTITTITDLTIDSFRQVLSEENLPTEGVENILYYIQDIDEFRIWDTSENKWVEPFHPIRFEDIPVADARTYTLYVVNNKIRYTIDNINWIEIDKHVDKYEQNTKYNKDMILYLDGITVRVVNDYISDNTKATTEESIKEDIANGKLVEIGGGAKLDRDITSNTDCGAAPKGSFFPEGMSFQDFAEKILIKEIEPTISTSFSNSGIKQCGVPVTSSIFKLVITNLSDVTYTIDKVEFYFDGNLIDTQAFVSGQSTYTFNYTNQIVSSVPKTFEAKAVLVYSTTKKVSGRAEFQFVYPSYTAVTTYSPITDAEANTIALTATKIIKKVKRYTWNNINVNDERFCYMYPASFGNLTSIVDGNGFNQMNSYTVYNVNITDVTTGNTEPYVVYLLTDPTTGTGFKQVYA